MKISKVLNNFLKKEITEGSTQNTIRYYKTHIGFFINFYGDKDINTVTYKVYENYINYLRNKNKESSGFKGKKEKLSGRTIKTYASALKTFLLYSYENGYLKQDISKNIKMPKYKKKVIQILNSSQIEQLINSFDKNTFVGARDKLIVALMLDCGLRLAEVVKLKGVDFDIQFNLLKVDGKGQKERFVPLTPYVLQCMLLYNNNYSIYFNKNIDINEQLIKTVDNKNASKNTISLVFRRLRNNLGFKLHPHLLRHTFATMFILNGGDIESLKIILGHTTIYMVENYLHLAQQMRMVQNIKFTPLANLKVLDNTN